MNLVAFGSSVTVLAGAMVGLQVAHERAGSTAEVDSQLLYVRSAAVLDKLSLSYDAVVADAYWIRALQHYGGTRLSKKPGKRYDLLYPLLDITTTLDPRFMIAYRFGAIFLAEGYPDGPGRPDLAIELLKKGMRAQPGKWQYLHDIGFVHYWWVGDYREAASWFGRAGKIPGAPVWLKPLAATTLAMGGDRGSSRLLWGQILASADNEWLRDMARLRLAQLDVLDQLDQLSAFVERYRASTGGLPGSWQDLVRAGLLRGIPPDPAGAPYHLDPATGEVDLAPDSPLYPLPLNLRRR